MKVSELINKLNALLDLYGDMDILIQNNILEEHYELLDVMVGENMFGMKTCVLCDKKYRRKDNDDEYYRN